MTAVDVRSGSPATSSEAGDGATQLRVLGNLRCSAGNGASAASNTSAVSFLEGDFGSFAAPAQVSAFTLQPTIYALDFVRHTSRSVAPSQVSLTASDPDNSEPEFGAGDELELAFSRPTNRDSTAATRGYVDSLFAFEPPVGDEYTGEWLDDATFRVVVLSVGMHAPAFGTASARVVGTVYDDARARQAAGGASVVLSGNYGVATSPRIVSFVADDPDDLDDEYSVGDTLTVTLDMATNRGDFNGSGVVPQEGPVICLICYETLYVSYVMVYVMLISYHRRGAGGRQHALLLLVARRQSRARR